MSTSGSRGGASRFGGGGLSNLHSDRSGRGSNRTSTESTVTSQHRGGGGAKTKSKRNNSTARTAAAAVAAAGTVRAASASTARKGAGAAAGKGAGAPRTNIPHSDPFDHPTSTAAQVEMLRYRASAHARARGGFFRRAALAFERGNHAQARQLSAAGHEQGARTEALNAEARDLLVATNSVGRDGREEIDLHGLHATEALDVVRACLDEHREERATWKGKGIPPTRNLTVITGKGLHSRSGQARLRPAVENLLQMQGVKFRAAPDGGSLKIVLR